jgi:hypothetical protein
MNKEGTLRKLLMCIVIFAVVSSTGCAFFKNVAAATGGFTVYTHGSVKTNSGQIVSDAPLPYRAVLGQVREWTPSSLGVYSRFDITTEGNGKKWLPMYVTEAFWDFAYACLTYADTNV